MSNDANLLEWQNQRELDASRRKSLILVLGSALLLALSAATMAYLLVKSIGRPLRVLERGTQRIAAGELDWRIDVRGRDEIARLSAAFNDMASKLSESYRTLESRVKQRTADLADRTDQLEKANLALQQSEQRWQATVENMLDPVTVCDAKGRAIYMNPAYEQLVERPIAHGLATRDHSDYYQIYLPDGNLFPPEELPLQKAARTGEAVRDIELIQRSANGREFRAVFSASPLRDIYGRVTGAVAIGRDVTEQRRVEQALQSTLADLESRVVKRTGELQQAYDRLKEEAEKRSKVEEQLRQSQKMEALGTLTGGIAHDFNNILAAIIGFTELVTDRVPPDSQDAHYLQRVMGASLRGRDLVRQMLTFSRQAEQEKRPFLVSAIVKETAKLLRASTPSTISIRTKIRCESGLILGDPTQIQQVIMNLCTNAAYAMRERGGILDIDLSDYTVSASNESGGMAPGPYVKLTVRDTGIGMAPQIMEKVFDPFFTTKKVGEGTGLGLSVVHGIVQQCHGHVTVESEPDKGATFSVYFPMIEEEGRTEAVSEEEIPIGFERILFVDDEEALAEMGEEILAELGYQVTSKTTSREALALFRLDPQRFDLVITDQTMPEVTGIDLAGEILTLRADMPVIMCTGFSELVDADRAQAAGIRAFVAKPLTKKEIAQTVRRVLDGQS